MKINKLNKEDYNITLDFKIIGPYNSETAAIDRLNELNKGIPNIRYNIMEVIQNEKDKNYFILLIENDLHLLKEEEKSMIVGSQKINITYRNYMPHVFRFMDKKYIDEFFKDGTLMISTFKKFRKLENDNRADINEGHHIIKSTKDNKTVNLNLGNSDNTLILCASLCSKNIGLNGREVEPSTAIEIQYPGLFFGCITKKLIELGYNVQDIICGPCVYDTSKNIQNNNIDDLSEEAFGIGSSGDYHYFDKDNKFIENIAKLNTVDSMFLKEIKYKNENEFRFIWSISDNLIDDHIVIKVPEAIKYCNKINIE